MKRINLFCYFSLILIFITSCNRNQKTMRTDTPTRGVAKFVSDDCFAPILEEQRIVFEGTNPDATLNAVYTNEVNAVQLILKDSIRMAVLARDLTDNEKQILRDKQLQPRSQKIAVDGIALIINKENTDTLISVATLKKIMIGELTSWKEINSQSKYDKIAVVFDNPNSSTVRFVKDSICMNLPFSDQLRSQETNQAVLDYVSKTPNAIGVIGVNWISNPSDSTNLSFIDGIKVMSVSRSDNATAKNSFKPYPYSIALGDYPLTRDVYIVLSDLRGTLLAGFVNFIAGDKGQRIITKAGLLPATRPMRLITVKDKF